MVTLSIKYKDTVQKVEIDSDKRIKDLKSELKNLGIKWF